MKKAATIHSRFGGQYDLSSADPEVRSRARKAMALESLRKIHAKSCEFRGKLALELLPRTCLGNTLAELIELIEPFNDVAVGVCLDTNHLMSDYRSIPGIVRKLGKKLFALHLSDYDGLDERHWLPGRGVVDWPAFLRALEEIGYDGPFNYECAFRPDERLVIIRENYSRLGGM